MYFVLLIILLVSGLVNMEHWYVSKIAIRLVEWETLIKAGKIKEALCKMHDIRNYEQCLKQRS